MIFYLKQFVRQIFSFEDLFICENNLNPLNFGQIYIILDKETYSL